MSVSLNLGGWSKKEDDFILSNLKNTSDCKAIGKKLSRSALSVLVRYKHLMGVRDGVSDCGNFAGIKRSYQASFPASALINELDSVYRAIMALCSDIGESHNIAIDVSVTVNS